MAYPSFGASWPGDSSDASTNANYVKLFKTAYADMIRLKAQTLDSVLSDTCSQQEVLRGDPLMLDSYTSVSLTQRDRGQQFGMGTGDTNYSETGNERRQLTPEFHEFAELFDPRDERALMRAIQPDGMYAMNVAAAFNRKKDDVILAALIGDVTLDGTSLPSVNARTRRVTLNGFRRDTGAAYGQSLADAASSEYGAGITGTAVANTATVAGNAIADTIGVGYGATASVALSEGGCQQIVKCDVTSLPTGFGAGSSNKGLHVRKLLVALEILQSNGAWQGQRIYCALHPEQVGELMQEMQYTSADYNALQPLMYGQPTSFLGIEFRVCNQIVKEEIIADIAGTGIFNTAGTTADTTTIGGRYAYVYTEDAVVLCQGDEMTVRFDEIPERGYALQCYHDFSVGAVRMDPKKVVVIPCAAGATFAASLAT